MANRLIHLKQIIIVFVGILFFSITADAFQETKLLMSVHLIRHGDRTATIYLPQSSHQWPEGLGQLTGEGMQQEFNLGNLLRKKYIEGYHLLPQQYDPASLYVRSTDYDRTLMSAQSLLLGLYPPGVGPRNALPHQFQPIPIHTMPKKNDKEFYGMSLVTQSMLEKYVRSRSDWIEKHKSLQPNFARWSQLTGISIQHLQDIIRVGDTLYVYRLHHIPLPPGLSHGEAETIIQEANWVFATTYKPYEISKTASRDLLIKIANWLESGKNPGNKLKFVLLSAHDGNILSVLSALKVPLENAPPYASDLGFDLFEVSSSRYVVKLSFNQHPVYIPACSSEACSLELLSDIMKN